MEKRVLNYRVIITPDERAGTNDRCYGAYCPTLDVTSEGDTVEEALANIKEAMELRLEVLAEDGEKIPVERDESFIVTTKISLPKLRNLRFAT
jgi:predicted RNase H-like HicB family nuclease